MEPKMDFTHVQGTSVGQPTPPETTEAEPAPTTARVIDLSAGREGSVNPFRAEPRHSPHSGDTVPAVLDEAATTEPLPNLDRSLPESDERGRETTSRPGAIGDLESLMRADVHAPARQGWLARLGLGGKAREVEEEQRRVLRRLTQPLPRPAVVGVANTKGGAGKTPVTIALGSALGTERGSTAAIDLWLRGNLGTRTVAHASEISIEDLRRALPTLTDGRHVSSADVMQYLRFQPTGKFAVLAAPVDIVGRDQPQQLLRSSLTGSEVHQVLDLVSRFHDITLVDTGNNDADEAWRAAVERMDVLVVPLKWQRDHILQAVQLLETLTDSGYKGLARGAVIVATHSAAERSKLNARDVARFREFFTSRGHTVHDLPADPVIANRGGLIEWDELAPATQHAARAIAATVIDRAADAQPRPELMSTTHEGETR